eukprot:223138-Amphidinium_carterae.1
MANAQIHPLPRSLLQDLNGAAVCVKETTTRSSSCRDASSAKPGLGAGDGALLEDTIVAFIVSGRVITFTSECQGFRKALPSPVSA